MLILTLIRGQISECNTHNRLKIKRFDIVNGSTLFGLTFLVYLFKCANVPLRLKGDRISEFFGILPEFSLIFLRDFTVKIMPHRF